MDTRTFFIVGLAVIGYFLWQAWQEDYAAPPAQPFTEIVADNSAADSDVIEAVADTSAVSADPTSERPGELPVAGGETSETSSASTMAEVTLESDVLRLHLNEKGARIDSAELLAYSRSIKDQTPTRLLSQGGERFFIAESGLTAAPGSEAPDHNAPYRFVAEDSQLSGSGELKAVFEWRQNGVSVRKSYALSPQSYVVTVSHQIRNEGTADWVAQPYYRFQRVALPSPSGFISNPETYSFAGAAVYTPEDKLHKLKFGNYEDDAAEFARSASGGWMAMPQHYFAAAWIPPESQTIDYSASSVKATPERFLIRARAPTLSIAAGGSQDVQARLFIGPKLQDELPNIAPGLDLTVDYGIFSFFSKPLFWLLEFLHDLVRNWGVAIILLTLLVKLAFFKLSEAQYRSMAKMRKVQPRLEALKEKYGDDRQKMAMAQMELFKKEKINPLGGCLPILVQIPVFIALYWVILESVELRQAPFFGWIQDLSIKDPFYILPVLNGLTMFITQRLSPTPGMDPVQRKVMQALPVVFSVLFAFFPAGLVLYWTTNGMLSLAQQWYIMRKVDGPKGKAPAKA